MLGNVPFRSSFCVTYASSFEQPEQRIWQFVDTQW